MKKIMDKLHNQVKINKNLLVFLITLMFIGIIVGSVFVTILSQTDRELIVTHLNGFLDTLETDKIDYFLVLKNNLTTNLVFIGVIWLLGISIIGLPIMIIMFFTKTFILGFSIGAILSTFGTKGILFSIIYVFPGQVISILFILLLMMYAMSFSFKLIYGIFKKKTIDFKVMINRYSIIFLIVLVGIVFMNLYDTYMMPRIVKSIITMIR